MKNKKKCAICATRFETSRSDARYCSNNCKQKAYVLRQKAGEVPKEEEMNFYLDEYHNLCNFFGCDSETLPLIFYCFLRKNLAIDANEDVIILYFSSIWTGNNYLELINTRAYYHFKENFLNSTNRVHNKK